MLIHASTTNYQQPSYAHAFSLSASPWESLWFLNQTKTFWCVLFLMLGIILSSLGIVYIQEKNRLLYSTLTQCQQKRDGLRVEWGQLLLEESTWSTQSRVARIAEQQLNMKIPKQQNIIITQV